MTHFMNSRETIAIEAIKGLAGTLLAHKMAGAMSEGGGDLADVAKAAQRAAPAAMTFGMSLDTCTVP